MQLTSDAEAAAIALAEGRLAALPTETVYGLGGRADDPTAVARIYAAKGRPADHPLIVHVLDMTAAHAWARHLPPYAQALADACWPGPLTLVLHRSPLAADYVTGAQDSVAIRVPAHPTMRTVLARVAALTEIPAIGIAAPSANRFGRVSPTTAAHVQAELGEVLDEQDVILDAGPCTVGIESTIIDCTADHPRMLRPGAISANEVERITGLPVTAGSPIRASGTLASHYAPAAPITLVLDEDEPAQLADLPADASVGLLALASVPTPPGVVRLSAPATPEDYAQALYAALREADALGLRRIIAIPPPPVGIGLGIRDRLTRAAHPSTRQ